MNNRILHALAFVPVMFSLLLAACGQSSSASEPRSITETACDSESVSVPVSTLAGSGLKGSANGTGTRASFALPTGITSDGDNLYITDRLNYQIRKIDLSTAEVSTLAGSGQEGAADGRGLNASFSAAQGITTDGRNLYVTDINNQLIRMVEISTGTVTTLAGSGEFGSGDGAGAAATFAYPEGITTDGSNLYIADTLNNMIRQIMISTGEVSTLSGTGQKGTKDGLTASFYYPNDLTTDGTSIFVADTGNHLIRKVVISTGETTTVAGTGYKGSEDGIGTAASFSYPSGIVTDGTCLYVVDSGNNLIRQITISTAEVTTLAGTGEEGAVDGSAKEASFHFPAKLVLAGRSLYITDTGNNLIRKIDLQK